MRLTRAGFAPREKVSSVNLNILMRGVAAKAGNIRRRRAIETMTSS